MSDHNNLYDCIVIGGGYAGISTATRLEQLSTDTSMLLLEATDRLGGRCKDSTSKSQTLPSPPSLRHP